MTLPSFKNARPFLAAALLPIFAAGCAQWSDRMSDVNGSTSEAAHSPAEGPGRIVSEDASFALRVADEMELHTAKKYWPFPTYGDLLFSVN